MGDGIGHTCIVLLVDDQPMIAETVRRVLSLEPDIEFHYCPDPAEALAVARRVRPTVILQDLLMPGVDGLALLGQYRADPATSDIPVIVLSTKEEAAVKSQAFALGASDYLVKLPDPIELAARVRLHSRGYIAQLERNEAYAALKRSQERLAEELAEAAKYLTSLLPERLKGSIETDWEFIPSAELGGDAFGYSWLSKVARRHGRGGPVALLRVDRHRAAPVRMEHAAVRRRDGQKLEAGFELLDREAVIERYGGVGRVHDWTPSLSGLSASRGPSPRRAESLLWRFGKV